jgi:uncharacterized protein YutE (UPF0331/DUF86 family)
MSADDVVLNKTATLERCVARVREEYAGDPARLEDPTHHDALVLNLQRACQAAIDLAMHVVRVRGLGVPQESRDAFRMLVDAGVLEAGLGERMMRMVGFRTIAVHDYQAISRPILQAIVEHRLGDFEAWGAWALRSAT